MKEAGVPLDPALGYPNRALRAREESSSSGESHTGGIWLSALHVFVLSGLLVALSAFITIRLERTRSTHFALEEAIQNSDDTSLGARARKRQIKEVYRRALLALDCLEKQASTEGEVGKAATDALQDLERTLREKSQRTK